MKHLFLFSFFFLCSATRAQSLLHICDSQEQVIHYALPDELMRPHFHCKGNGSCTHCTYVDSAFRVIAAELNKLTIIGCDITVHADLRGSATFNDSLTQQQAAAIFRQLTQSGADLGNVALYGKGEREPLVPEEIINRYKNDRRTYEDLHWQNRRFELRVIFYDPESVNQSGRE